LVRFREMPDEFEPGTYRARQFFDAVPLDVKTAALQRPVFRERCDDKMPARLQRPVQVDEVQIAVVRICQKMEDGTVVPEVILVFG